MCARIPFITTPSLFFLPATAGEESERVRRERMAAMYHHHFWRACHCQHECLSHVHIVISMLECFLLLFIQFVVSSPVPVSPPPTHHTNHQQGRGQEGRKGGRCVCVVVGRQVG